jgi:hypothetical protein
LLAEGNLNEAGQFVFRFTEAEPLEVIVFAGAGHRKSFVIPREKLDASAPPSPTDDGTTSAPAPQFIIDRGDAWRDRLKDALIGISFLLAVAAFLLSWRNGQKLKALQRPDTPTAEEKTSCDPS